jgi:hypothetical protein
VGSGRRDLDRDRRAGPVYETARSGLVGLLAPVRPEPMLTVARTVADVLAEHVSFEVECIDRMYLNVYVPQLQYAAGLVGFVHRRLGLPIASTAPLAPISDGFSKAMRRFAGEQGVPWVDFVKGQRKDDVMHQHLARFTGTEGVLFIGRAQEKTVLFRTEKRRNAEGVAWACHSNCVSRRCTKIGLSYWQPEGASRDRGHIAGSVIVECWP